MIFEKYKKVMSKDLRFMGIHAPVIHLADSASLFFLNLEYVCICFNEHQLLLKVKMGFIRNSA